MRIARPTLIAYLNTLGPKDCPYIADLLTIVQVDGTITRVTSAPVDIISTSMYPTFFDGTLRTFAAGGITFSRGTAKLIIGLEVDDMQLGLMTDPTLHTLGGIPWPSAARQGALDGARIMLERAYMPTWGDTSYGTLILFSGTVGDIQASRNDVMIIVKSNINVLAAPLPRNSYQPGCLHRLFDTGCGLTQASFTTTGTVQAGSTTSLVNTNLGAATDYYNQGQITFTSGALNGMKRMVKSYTNAGGVVEVQPKLDSVPANGVTFSIIPGCDKTQATCSAKFANLTRFRGYPFVPVPENIA
jgi:uncharacterized phage protein (TIGR02218 family)